MATRAEKEAQIKALQAELDDDDDLELWVEHDGRKTQLRGAHAQKWLRKLGLDDDEADAGDAGDDADADAEPPKRKMSERFFDSQPRAKK